MSNQGIYVDIAGKFGGVYQRRYDRDKLCHISRAIKWSCKKKFGDRPVQSERV